MADPEPDDVRTVLDPDSTRRLEDIPLAAPPLGPAGPQGVESLVQRVSST